MTRPLIITDCDEVLLHMVVPFGQWLDEAHHVHFDLRERGFAEALRHKDSGAPLERDHVWALLLGFFETEMHRQAPIAGAVEALHRLSRVADIEVLTNITERHQQARAQQLAAHGLHVPVHWNQGGKGRPLADIVAARAPSAALFIDDLAEHHHSVATHAPGVWRLHMVGEPKIAADIPPAPHAHARIDNWAAAEQWIIQKLAQGPAPDDMPATHGVTA
ncbi:HAD family hydrolase [Sphingobium sp. HBC34]|uniref:HAD family hydrolase n=1 Tax=Sphingobium cyanobacteriorum TaxID=3063954 RepID=A0ABT8ZN30_9SPHN|nr:HAD family hydrolase [Sphingobium sp. HBC34]MDO7835950.1 HAD family hydrolase [Sphingobium sp. HBC34]